ncbi:MAG: hypothetical protein KDJ99_26500, partial [Candidatus Competibacteraceae bacterium]|nr:hypothetical protein [Candidatus Competibacteraceae bacterium]
MSRPEERDIGADDDSDEEPVSAHPWPSRPPWALDGSESGRLWRLTDALDDPLLTLPPLPEDIQLPAQPFRNLASFEREQARIFFGRGRDIANLYRQLTDPKSAPILLLFGQSGVGKSSVLAAGVLPRLEGAFDIAYLRRTPSSETVAAIHRLLNPEAKADESNTLTLLHAWQQREQRRHKPLLLVLDQLDDLLRLPPNDDTRSGYAALTALFGAATPAVQGRLILGFREEYLAGLENQLQDYGLPYSSYYLKTLDQRGVREAVEGVVRDPQTLERYRLRIEDPDDQPLAATIWTDLHADPNAPLATTLQILLTKLWTAALARNRAAPTFNLALYQQLKQDGIFLEDFLDQQLTALGQQYPEADDSGLLIDLLYHHTTPSGASDQHTLPALQAYYAHSQDQLPGLLNAAQDLHLLTVSLVTASGHAPQQTVSRLSHDTLAPLIQRRYEQSDKPGQQARRILEARLQEQAHNPDTLLPEEDLVIVAAGQAGMRAWSESEQDLVQRSRELQLKRQRQKKRWQWAGIAAIVLITVVSLVATGLWQRAEQKTVEALKSAHAEKLAKQEVIAQEKKTAQERDNALRLQSLFLAELSHQQTEQGFTTQGILLALEGLPSPTKLRPAVREPEAALYAAVANHKLQHIFHHNGYVEHAVFSPDGQHIFTLSADNTARLWDAQTGQALHTLQGHTSSIYSAVFSP